MASAGVVDLHARPPNPKNPIVFFDITIGSIPAGRMKMELFADIVPKTAKNFRKAGLPFGYKYCQFHRVIKGFMIQAGDIVKGDGSGCVYLFMAVSAMMRTLLPNILAQDYFQCMSNPLGLITVFGKALLANSGPDTNGCQFFITCGKCDRLDNKHVVFGRVLGDGLLVVRKIENVATGPNNRPKLECVISQCGEM